MSARLPAGARREQILDVAVQVFAQRGFHGASMNDVADAAGVTKPVLYQHFASKQGLYLALLEEVGRRLLNAIAKATAGATSGKSQTELGFKAYFRWVAEDHDAFLLLFGTQANRDDASTAAIRRMTADTADAIAPLIAVDIDPEYQRTLAHGLVGLAEGVSRRLVERGQSFDPDELGSQVANLAWAGLRAVGQSAPHPLRAGPRS
jgi:AcrR family transcriptional regulator